MPSETRTCRRAGESMRAWYGTGSAGRQIGRAQRAPLVAMTSPCRARQATANRPAHACCKPWRAQSRAAAARPMARDTHVARRGPRRPMTARLSLVGRSSPLLADDARRPPSARPLAGAPGGRLPDHPCESAFWHAPDECLYLADDAHLKREVQISVLRPGRRQGLRQSGSLTMAWSAAPLVCTFDVARRTSGTCTCTCSHAHMLTCSTCTCTCYMHMHMHMLTCTCSHAHAHALSPC